jgi:hypothetical protein
MSSEARRERRAAQRELAKAIGWEKAGELRSVVSKTKEAHDLCLCNDGTDVRSYSSDEEKRADRRPTEFCAHCGKKRLLVALIKGELQNERAEITVGKREVDL